MIAFFIPHGCLRVLSFLYTLGTLSLEYRIAASKRWNRGVKEKSSFGRRLPPPRMVGHSDESSFMKLSQVNGQQGLNSFFSFSGLFTSLVAIAYLTLKVDLSVSFLFVNQVKYPAAELRGIQFSKKLSSPLTGED